MIGEYQIEFITDYWDGPMNGICSKDGVRYLFICTKDEPRQRDYTIYALSPEQLRTIDEHIADFEKYVGNHCTYINGRRNPQAKMMPKEERDKFYEKWKGTDIDLEHGELVDSWSEIEIEAK